jgi:hypothetical protein
LYRLGISLVKKSYQRRARRTAKNAKVLIGRFARYELFVLYVVNCLGVLRLSGESF